MSVVAIPELVTINIAGQSDQGKVPEENQAVARHARTQFGDLLVVADGIGDAGAGSQASQQAADTISSRLEGMPAFFPSEIAVEEAVRQANTELTAMAALPDSPYNSVGVTLIVALLRTVGDQARAIIGRVGDSRAYVVRNRKLSLLTRDHSAAPDVIDENWTTPQEAETYPDPSTPARYLGEKLNFHVEMREMPLQAGDTLLLCSGGLWSHVSEQEIERLLADGSRSVEDASSALLNLALDAGGHDSVAIEIARLTQNSSSSAEAAEAPASELEPIDALQAEMPLFRSFQTSIDAERGQKTASRWLTIFSVVIAIPMLCVLIFLVMKAHSGAPFIANLVQQPAAAAVGTQPQSNVQEPSHGVKITINQPRAANEVQPGSKVQPDNNQRAVKPAEAQTETTDDQLPAQTKIPQGRKRQATANESSSAGHGAAHADGRVGRDSIVNRDTEPVDRDEASSPVAVSADSEAGRLMESRVPIYPPIAKASGVSGTVELEATIAKDGTVKDMRVVSGPVQLRQAAIQSVRTWRYRPFMLNKEPREVETTINVVFSLDK